MSDILILLLIIGVWFLFRLGYCPDWAYPPEMRPACPGSGQEEKNESNRIDRTLKKPSRGQVTA